MLTHEKLWDTHMNPHSRRLLQQCAHLVSAPRQSRAITTTCAKRASNGTSANSPGFLGTTWDSGKLPKSVRAFEPNRVESGLVRGAAVVSFFSCCMQPHWVPVRFTIRCRPLTLLCRCGLTIKLSNFRGEHTSCGTTVGQRQSLSSRRLAAQRQQPSLRRLQYGKALFATGAACLDIYSRITTPSQLVC